MPYPMKSKLTPEEVIRKVLDEAHSDGWKLQPIIARHKLSEKIWENILSNFPEVRLANEIEKKVLAKCMPENSEQTEVDKPQTEK